MIGVATKHVVAMVDMVYNGETKVKERDCEEFLKILEKCNILKVKASSFKFKPKTIHLQKDWFTKALKRISPITIMKVLKNL